MSTGLSRKGFDIDLRDGQLMEGKVARLLAEAGPLIEVKADHKALTTGRVFLEFEQAGPPTFQPRPSGLAVTTAEWWVTVLVDGNVIRAVLLHPTTFVRALGRIAFRKGYHAKGGDNDLYRGVLVPLGWFLRREHGLGQNEDSTWGELGWRTEADYREWGP